MKRVNWFLRYFNFFYQIFRSWFAVMLRFWAARALFLVAALAAPLAVGMTGCASKPTGYHGVDEIDESSRQHPSSYFIDRFSVEKEMPKSRRSTVPFYFKKCSEVGESFPSRTSYECDYPF